MDAFGNLCAALHRLRILGGLVCLLHGQGRCRGIGVHRCIGIDGGYILIRQTELFEFIIIEFDARVVPFVFVIPVDDRRRDASAVRVHRWEVQARLGIGHVEHLAIQIGADIACARIDGRHELVFLDAFGLVFGECGLVGQMVELGADQAQGVGMAHVHAGHEVARHIVGAFVAGKSALDDFTRLTDELFLVIPNLVRKVAMLPILFRSTLDLLGMADTQLCIDIAEHR